MSKPVQTAIFLSLKFNKKKINMASSVDIELLSRRVAILGGMWCMYRCCRERPIATNAKELQKRKDAIIAKLKFGEELSDADIATLKETPTEVEEEKRQPRKWSCCCVCKQCCMWLIGFAVFMLFIGSQFVTDPSVQGEDESVSEYFARQAAMLE